MNAGSMMERLFFFIAEYQPDKRKDTGGGVESEGEDIAVLKLPFDKVCAMMGKGEIIGRKRRTSTRVPRVSRSRALSLPTELKEKLRNPVRIRDLGTRHNCVQMPDEHLGTRKVFRIRLLQAA